MPAPCLCRSPYLQVHKEAGGQGRLRLQGQKIGGTTGARNLYWENGSGVSLGKADHVKKGLGVGNGRGARLQRTPEKCRSKLLGGAMEGLCEDKNFWDVFLQHFERDWPRLSTSAS